MTRDASAGSSASAAGSADAGGSAASAESRRFTVRRLVEFRDTDAAAIVHFSAFFFWMESAEHELLRAVGLQVIERQPDGTEISWPRVSASCDYVSALRFGEAVDIAVSVAATGRSSITYHFRFDCDGRRVAEGRVVAVRCVMHPGRKPEAVPIPADIIAKLTAVAG